MDTERGAARRLPGALAGYYPRLQRHYRSYWADAGLVLVLKSMEQSSTFISYEPRRTPPSGDDYRLIKRAAKRFLH